MRKLAGLLLIFILFSSVSTGFADTSSIGTDLSQDVEQNMTEHTTEHPHSETEGPKDQTGSEGFIDMIKSFLSGLV